MEPLSLLVQRIQQLVKRGGGDKHRTHGLSRSRTYKSWCGMKDRCLNAESTHFKDYGGRGIKIDPEWMTFDGFLADMGEAPAGCSIDRIDNNAGYNASNCRWATPLIQSRNRRCAKLSPDEAALILTMRRNGVTQARVANLFAVSKSTIKDIDACRIWQDAALLPL